MGSIRVLVISIGVIAPALALAGPFRGACTSDVKALCGSVQPGQGRIRECMKEHRAELSIACKAAIADRMLERSSNKAVPGPAPAKSTTGSGD